MSLQFYRVTDIKDIHFHYCENQGQNLQGSILLRVEESEGLAAGSIVPGVHTGHGGIGWLSVKNVLKTDVHLHKYNDK